MSGAMPGPWGWVVHDVSAASLTGPDGETDVVLTGGPCSSCIDMADPKEWKWGRCAAPSHEDAALIAAAPDLLAALKQITNDYVALLDSGDCGTGGPGAENTPEVQAARAAISKATAP